MALATYIILFGLLKLCSAEDCLINNTPRYLIWEKQLQEDLTCTDDTTRYDAPQSASGPLPVNFRFILKYFRFNADEEVLSLQVWLFISWKDERLQWDPEKYGGIEKTKRHSYGIWTPSLLLYNSADSEDYDRFFSTTCSVRSSGEILCVPRLIHQVKCSVDLSDFPYDKQQCSLLYGPWHHHNFNMNTSSKAIMWEAAFGSQWDIVDYTQKLSNSSQVQLNMTFILVRQVQSLGYVIVYPSLIISGLTIACLFLDVKSNIRLGLLSFNILCHYFWLTELADNIPKETAFPPRILLYYRGSTIITVLLLPVTFLLAVVCRKVTEPHNIVTSVNDFVYTSFARYLVYLRPATDGTVLINGDKYNEDWTKFADAVNSFCAVVVVITYIGLYIAFIPQPII